MSVGHVGLTCCTLDFQEAEPSCSCHLLPLESSLYTRIQPRKVLLTGFQGWRLSRQTLGGSTELFSGDGLPFRKLGSELFCVEPAALGTRHVECHRDGLGIRAGGSLDEVCCFTLYGILALKKYSADETFPGVCILRVIILCRPVCIWQWHNVVMVTVDTARKAHTLHPKIQERTLGETLSFLLVAAVTCTVLEHLSLCLLVVV